MSERNGGHVAAIAAASVLAIVWPCAAGEKVMFDFEAGFDVSKVKTHAASVEPRRADGGTVLAIRGDGKERWAGVTLEAPAGRWDLGAFECVTLDVRCAGKTAVTVACRLWEQGGDDKTGHNEGRIRLAPGGKGQLTVAFRRPIAGGEKLRLSGMRGLPPRLQRRYVIDPARLGRVRVFVSAADGGAFDVEIDDLRAAGQYDPAKDVTGETFLPFLDEFGQYIHKDWPGKTHAMGDLAARKQAEAKELTAQPGPADWDRYGGWARGPKLQASGFFRAEKHQGKWWLVDPDGRLFFSHGIDCVHAGEPTPIDERDAWFVKLPPAEGPFAECYGRAGHVVRDYYKGKQPRTFDHARANVIRKYGRDWAAPFADVTHERLRSWGLNTIGSWSDSKIHALKRTPYVVIVSTEGKPIAGSSGYWRQFSDVFDESFRAALDRRMADQESKAAGDPMCLGFFVDNELSWGKETDLAAATLASPADQPAKLAFLADLKAKYRDVVKLNAAWGAAHDSWEALLADRKPPDARKAHADLLAFNDRIVNEYFRTCRQAVKKHAPGQLYLGCRFAWSNPRVITLAGDHCDVMSFNLYRRSVADFRLPDGLDKPVIIGEFHFGALDRGMFHTGLVPVADQIERAEAYKNYVLEAARHPNFVGCHWFKYRDQSTVGRALDGEDYQIGFLDIVDTPYPEIIQASRQAAAELYPARLGEK